MQILIDDMMPMMERVVIVNMPHLNPLSITREGLAQCASHRAFLENNRLLQLMLLLLLMLDSFFPPAKNCQCDAHIDSMPVVVVVVAVLYPLPSPPCDLLFDCLGCCPYPSRQFPTTDLLK